MASEKQVAPGPASSGGGRERGARLRLAVGAAGAVALLATVLIVTLGGDSDQTSALPSPDTVAQILDARVTRQELDHWTSIAAAAKTAPISYEPPRFTACVAGKREVPPKRGEAVLSERQLVEQCRQEYKSLRDQALHFLVTERWFRGEAAERGVKISSVELEEEFTKARRETFSTQDDFEKFLTTTGMSHDDARFQVDYNTIYARLRDGSARGSDGKIDKRKEELFATNLRKKWKARTHCHAGFVTDVCGNAPATTTTPDG